MKFFRREKTYKLRVTEEELQILVWATKVPYNGWEEDAGLSSWKSPQGLLHARLYELAKPRDGDPEYEHLKQLAAESINHHWSGPAIPREVS